MIFTVLEISLVIVGASTVVWGWLEFKKKTPKNFSGLSDYG